MKSSTLNAVQRFPWQSIKPLQRREHGSFLCKRGCHKKSIFYTLNLELATPLPAILSTRRRPKGKPRKDRTTPPISVLQSGHTAFILSHLSTHCTWKKCVQGSSRSSSSSPYLVRQMQHTCINISRLYSYHTVKETILCYWIMKIDMVRVGFGYLGNLVSSGLWQFIMNSWGSSLTK